MSGIPWRVIQPENWASAQSKVGERGMASSPGGHVADAEKLSETFGRKEQVHQVHMMCAAIGYQGRSEVKVAMSL